MQEAFISKEAFISRQCCKTHEKIFQSRRVDRILAELILAPSLMFDTPDLNVKHGLTMRNHLLLTLQERFPNHRCCRSRLQEEIFINNLHFN